MTQAPKRQRLSKQARASLWIEWFGDHYFGRCPCCRLEQVSVGNFHAAHIEAHVLGGSIDRSNLVPVCMPCNLGMGTQNLVAYMVAHGYPPLERAPWDPAALLPGTPASPDPPHVEIATTTLSEPVQASGCGCSGGKSKGGCLVL